VRLALDGDGDEVRLTVHNRGPAIAPELLGQLFEPFRRGTGARARGLGLGLYISREIVRAHGGGIDVHSSDVEGTTFVVHLPRRRH
jgi:signal transduction histidine kinase